MKRFRRWLANRIAPAENRRVRLRLDPPVQSDAFYRLLREAARK